MRDWLYRRKYRKIQRKFDRCFKNMRMDVSACDIEICKLADKIYQSHKSEFHAPTTNGCDAGFFASVLYETGGHTVSMLNGLESLAEDMSIHVFCSKKAETQSGAPGVVTRIRKCAKFDGLECPGNDFVHDLIELYNMIADDCPRVAFVFIHMWDLLFTAVMHLLKQNTGLKIIFSNHASHFPNVGMTLADIILEGMPTTQQITENKRHLHNCRIVGLQSVGINDTKYYSRSEINAKKKELSIPLRAPLTVSGGSAYKFFDGDVSPYFEMIRDILHSRPTLHHMVISNPDKSQSMLIDKIFENDTAARARLHIVPLTPDFDLLFQCADVFIDSFPVSSAMTQIDLMRMRIASVVKINRDKPIYSFHEYMPADYPYMYDNVADMRRGIEHLLDNGDARRRIIASEYEYWMKNYERGAFKCKYKNIIKELV